ncbi:uncharacterized protein DNG_08590 [Cephalotrichum gorgonifer]|uniref:Uncharacterized protein n=1 Tax=Cephalotrichum gorgonifer TaxID=2041049 RepID=A0AAE8N3U2_9PEZI|nr:uncharacterized protein DNG_08590 [Cephalotrichum gorgonifer]
MPIRTSAFRKEAAATILSARRLYVKTLLHLACSSEIQSSRAGRLGWSTYQPLEPNLKSLRHLRATIPPRHEPVFDSPKVAFLTATSAPHNEQGWAVRLGDHGDTPASPQLRKKTQREEVDATPEGVRYLISLKRRKLSHQVWNLYEQLPTKDKDALRLEVLGYLSRFPSFHLNPGRCWSLVAQLGEASLDDVALLAAVRSSLVLGLHTETLRYFRRSLDRDVSSTMFEEIIRFSFKASSWPLLWGVWRTWYLSRPQGTEPLSIACLHTVPNLFLEGAVPKFLAHLAHLAKQGYRHENTAETDHSLDTEDTDDLPPNSPKAIAEFLDDLESTQRLQETASHPVVTTDSMLASNGHDPLILSLASFVLEFLGKALPRSNPTKAMDILHRIRSPKLYVDYFLETAQQGPTLHLPQLFRSHKSLLLEGADPRVLPAAFDIFYVHRDRDGLLEVHKDFCHMYYDSVKDEGSSRDPSILRNWWSDYAVRGALPGQAQDHDTYSDYIAVFKFYGDTDMVQFALNDVFGRLGAKREDRAWYAKLATYVQAKDYEGAMDAWKPRFDKGEPDLHTLATLMGLSSERGDLAFTLGLYEKAKEWQLRQSPRILIPLIRVFGGHGFLPEASRICSWAMDNGVLDVEVYNTMLEIYASRHRVHEAHRLVTAMEAKGITCDAESYKHIITALARCKQGHEAFKLLGQAPELSFRGFSASHFEVLMVGALNMKRYAVMYKLAQRMEDIGLPMSPSTTLLLAKAGHRWAREEGSEKVPRKLVTSKDLVESYRKFAESAAATNAQQRRSGRRYDESFDASEFPRERRLLHPLTFKRVVFAMAEMGDAEGLREVTSIFLRRPWNELVLVDLPTSVLSAMMILDFANGDNQGVRRLWRIIWERHLKLSVGSRDGRLHSTAPKVAPDAQYALDEGFKVLQQVMAQETDAEGLIAVLHEVTSAGFQLGQRSWNHTIQALAVMGKWKEAFTLNERMLMPNWTGWRHMRKLKIMTRRRTAFENHEKAEEHQPSTDDAATAVKRAGELTLGASDSTGAPWGSEWYAEQSDRTPTETPGPAPAEQKQERGEPLSEEDRQYQEEHTSVADYLQTQYNIRQVRRRQKERKASGTSPRLAPRFLNPGKNPRFLRPNSHTLMLLGKMYLNMKDMDGWAAEAHAWISMYCARTAHAAMTMTSVGEVEGYPGYEQDGDRAAYKDEGRGGAEEGGAKPRVSEEFKGVIARVLAEAPQRKADRKEARRRQQKREKKLEMERRREEALAEERRRAGLGEEWIPEGDAEREKLRELLGTRSEAEDQEDLADPVEDSADEDAEPNGWDKMEKAVGESTLRSSKKRRKR